MTDESGDVRATLTRRGLFGAGAAAGVGAVGVGTEMIGSEASASADGPWLSGVVERLSGAEQFELRLAPDWDRVVPIRLTADAVVLRDGPASLGDFAAGEEVSAGGSWNGGVYVATNLESTYRLVDADVDSRRGDLLQTDDGEVLLPPDTDARGGLAPNGSDLLVADPERVRAGDHIVLLGRLVPGTKRLIASVFGLSTDA